jgi:hypothetical protein
MVRWWWAAAAGSGQRSVVSTWRQVASASASTSGSSWSWSRPRSVCCEVEVDGRSTCTKHAQQVAAGRSRKIWRILLGVPTEVE